MSSSRRVRPRTAVRVQTGRFDHSESGRLSSDRVRRLLGEECTLDDTQLEELTDGLNALADFAVTAFVEQRKHRKLIVSEQPMPIAVAAAPIVAVV